MVKAEYWNVTDDQVVEKTGQPIAYWMTVLETFGADTRKSTEAVAFLQREHALPRYWARTLTTLYFKSVSG